MFQLIETKNKMEIQVISQEIVKPSFPTPSTLKTFKLSILDQLIPAPYVPIVLYYPNYNGAPHSHVLERLHSLKTSLSETLTLFYPLAGTIKDDLSIECNDHGAYYATAKINCYLYEFLDKPDLQSICKFLPCDPGSNGSMAGTRVTNIQVNLFECGGIAIGLCISHKILDGAALKTFLKAWAGNANGTEEEEPISPEFISSSLFPADGLWMKDSAMAMWAAGFKKGKSVTKRVVFSGAAITKLKLMAASRSDVRCPTRVESVSAFLWKLAKTACSEVNGSNSKRASLLTHIVNLRRRAIPNLPENSMGNLIWIAGAKCRGNREAELPVLAEQIRLSISKINGDHVKKLRGQKGSVLMRKSLKDMGDFMSKEEVDYFGFSSWCGFGYYEIDFGWGKPIWISSIPLSAPVFMNLIILTDTKYGDGIEAWVTLDEREMNVLEQSKELLAFGSMDPRPLNLGSFE